MHGSTTTKWLTMDGWVEQPILYHTAKTGLGLRLFYGSLPLLDSQLSKQWGIQENFHIPTQVNSMHLLTPTFSNSKLLDRNHFTFEKLICAIDGSGPLKPPGQE